MRTPIPLLILVLCSTIFATNVHAQNFCHGKPCIQVGTFNIEWFGTSDITKHAHRSPQRVKKIANLIADTLDLEIVVLEEINSESEEYTRLRDALALRGYKLRRIGTSGGEQGVVIAFDADQVTLLDDGGGHGVKEMSVRSAFDLGGGCVNSNLRVPIYGKFKAGEFEFVLIGVHFKAQPGVHGAANPEQCSDDIRRAQVQDILAALPSILSSNDQDVIITGDFNAPLNDASLGPFFSPQGGFISLTTAGRRAQESGTISYLKAPFQEIIDHVLIRPANTTEWSMRSTLIYKPNPLSNYLKFTSDHAPVWTSFIIDGN